MTEGQLEDFDIRKAERQRDTDHLVVDVGSARIHATLAADKGCITVHDGDTQASIILDDSQDVTTVTHEDDVAVINRTDGVLDPLAVTSR